jgi:hypothetical protein
LRPILALRGWGFCFAALALPVSENNPAPGALEKVRTFALQLPTISEKPRQRRKKLAPGASPGKAKEIKAPSPLKRA